MTNPPNRFHPHFTSGLRWTTSFSEALSEAQSNHRAVFLVYGAADCQGTRGLIERTLSKEEVSEMVTARFVCLAAAPVDPPPEVSALVASLARNTPTPLCLYLDANGKLLHSTAGGRPAAVLINDMLESLSKQKRA